jgi:hypothetical protein
MNNTLLATGKGHWLVSSRHSLGPPVRLMASDCLQPLCRSASGSRPVCWGPRASRHAGLAPTGAAWWPLVRDGEIGWGPGIPERRGFGGGAPAAGGLDPGPRAGGPGRQRQDSCGLAVGLAATRPVSSGALALSMAQPGAVGELVRHKASGRRRACPVAGRLSAGADLVLPLGLARRAAGALAQRRRAGRSGPSGPP